MFESTTLIITCVTSIGAFVVSWVALKVSNQVTILNSKQYVPRFDIMFLEKGISLKNRDRNLFDIFRVDIVIIQHTGYVDFMSDKEVNMSFVTVNRTFGDYHLGLPLHRYKKLIYKDGDDLFSPSETNRDIYEGVRSCLNTKYDMDSKIGNALPYFNSSVYYVNVTYKNRFGEHKNYILKRIPGNHGAGEISTELSSNEYKTELNEYHNIPSFDTVEKAFDYFKKLNE